MCLNKGLETKVLTVADGTSGVQSIDAAGCGSSQQNKRPLDTQQPGKTPAASVPLGSRQRRVDCRKPRGKLPSIGQTLRQQARNAVKREANPVSRSSSTPLRRSRNPLSTSPR